MKLSSLVVSGFAVVLLLFAITAFMNCRQYDRVTESIQHADRSATIIRKSNRLQRNFFAMSSTLRDYFISGDPQLLHHYDTTSERTMALLRDLSGLVNDGSDQQILLEDARELIDYWKENFVAPLVNAKSGDTITFVALYGEKQAGNLDRDVQASLQKKISEFTKLEYASRLNDQRFLLSSLASTRNTSIYFTALAILFGLVLSIGLGVYMNVRLKPMVRLIRQVTDGSYAVSAAEYGNNEFSELAVALNQMSSSLEMKFQQLRRQKEDADQFAYTVSHDLKTPLRGIDNIVNWILEDYGHTVPTAVRDLVDKIKGRAVRAQHLLRGVLSYTLAGRNTAMREIVDVNEVVRDIYNDLASSSDVTVQIQTGLPVLFTQRVPLEQVFSNLLGNAFKYSDKVNGVVKVYYRTESLYYRFFVEDNGPGIPPGSQHKIFTLFETLRMREGIESMGVGLAIVKKILDERQLAIEVTKAPHGGAIFSFTWPRHDDHEGDSYTSD